MQKSELNYLTVLRAFAAVWVAIHHCFGSLEGMNLPDSLILSTFISRGWLGVDLFFILSGFILAYSYQGKMDEFQTNTYWNFLIKRFARIYPAHLFVLGLYAIIITSASILNLFNDQDGKFDGIDFIAQAFLIHGIGFFESTGWNMPSWSVSSEALAYIYFPLLILPLQKLTRASYHLIVIISILLITIWLAWNFNHAQKFMLNFEYSWIRILTEFVMGICLFHVTQISSKRKSYGLLAAAMVGCIFFQGLVDSSFFDFMYLIYFMVLIHALALIPTYKRIPFFTKLGEVSYSFYLIHSLIIILLNQLIRKVSFLEQHSLLSLLLFLIIAQISALIIYAGVEVPARNTINSWLVRRPESFWKISMNQVLDE